MRTWFVLFVALVAAASPAVAGTARFPRGRYACVGPGDWSERGTLVLRPHGHYVYRHTLPPMDHRVAHGRYRVSGRRIRFLTGEFRDRGFMGLWRRATQADPDGWIHFRFTRDGPYMRRGADARFNCGKL